MHWLTQSTRPEAQISRRTVNNWFKEFKDSDGRFTSRLRSEVDVDHYQALDELHIHHLLRSCYDDVRYEEGGGGPDFRVYEEGKCIAAIEVLSLFERSDWNQEQRRHARLADELDKRFRPTAGYFIDFEIERADKDPAPRRFADFIGKCIAELPSPEDLQLPPEPKAHHLPTEMYEGDGCRIRVRFLPMAPGAAAKSDPDARIVGTGAAVGGIVNSGLRLRERLMSKAGGRYDVTGVPFLVAACIHDLFCSDYEVLAALYGGEAVMVETGQREREQTGLFGIDGKQRLGRNTRVSAVSVVSGFKLWSINDADVAILENPYAASPWPRNVFPANRWYGSVGGNSTMIKLGWSRVDQDRSG